MKHQASYAGDLISDTQREDFRLSQETVTDWAKIVREKIEREQAIYEFEHEQGRLL